MPMGWCEASTASSRLVRTNRKSKPQTNLTIKLAAIDWPCELSHTLQLCRDIYFHQFLLMWGFPMSDSFPAVGRRYAVDFVAFKVELYFSSATSLTYTPIADNGARGQPETVTI